LQPHHNYLVEELKMSEPQKKETTLHFLDYWRVIRSRKEIVMAVLFLVVITGTAYTFTLPKIYAAEARIQVNNDSVDLDPFNPATSGMRAYDPYFLRTQFEIIQSKPILYEVINRLNLQEIWGKKGEQISKEIAYKILRSSLNISQSRDTSLIALTAMREDPKEAARIANELADVYRDVRLDLKYKEMTRAMDALGRELEKQQEKVDTASRRVEQLRQELDITVLPGSYAGQNENSVEKLRLQQLEGDRIAARVEMLVARARFEQLESMSNEDLQTASAYLTQDPFVEAMRTQIKDYDVALTSLLENYGPNYPEVKQTQAARDELLTKLQRALGGIKKGTQAQYIVAKSKFEALEEELRGVKSSDQETQRDKFVPFNKAQQELDIQRSIMNALKARIAQEGITLKVPRTPVEIVDSAEESSRPISPKLILNVLLSIFIGLFSGIGLAYFIEYLDTSIKTADDIERWVGLPVLGLIPQKVRPLIEEGPDSEHAEGYRVLRTNMAFADSGPSRGAFAVLSGGAGEGKSTTAFNLAYICAQQGEKVLLVDADVRRPVQHTILGVSNRFGLTNVLLRDVPVEETIKTTSVPNLHFLPSGRMPRTSLGVLDPKRISELVHSLKLKYDIIVFDTPPLVGISDSSVIAKEMDGVLLVVQYRKYPRDMIIRAKQMLDTLGVPQVGVVLNNINIMRDDYYYYYHSYYSNYYNNSQESTPVVSQDV
jgi:succinoglycan biosynthesis transport protein ExoP